MAAVAAAGTAAGTPTVTLPEKASGGKGSVNNWAGKTPVWQPWWTKKGKGWGKGWGGWGWGGGKPSGPSVPADFTVDESVRHNGTVQKYNKFKGCGFIELKTKGTVPGDKCFVFWRNIRSEDRFPQLKDGMEVECNLKINTDKYAGVREVVATNVTMPGGTLIALQDQEDFEKKEFVGGQNLRYTGTLKFFDPRHGYGYVSLDEGYAIDEPVPKELRLERSEVNAGGKQPIKMEDLAVEFGIWKTTKGEFKVYNMTLPGGVPLMQENLENRMLLGSKPLKGEVIMWSIQRGWGYISPENPAMIPAQAKAVMTEQSAKAKARAEEKGRTYNDGDWIYVRRADVDSGTRLEEGMKVTFQLYQDDKGVGAMTVTAAQ